MTSFEIHDLRAAVHEAKQAQTADEKLVAVEKTLTSILRIFQEQERAARSAMLNQL